MIIEDVTKEFPTLKVKELNNGTGCNLYLPGKLIVTVFFKSKLFKTNEMRKYRRFSGKDDMLKIICALGNIKLKATNETIEPEQSVILSGTQLCIDHINKKIKLIEANTNNNQLIVVLKALSQEFEQFL